MLKKFLAITLVITMVFALTGCDTFGKAFDTLGDLLNGERENEKDMADGELDEEYHFSYIGPDGEIGELPDGEFYFQFETDEEGNMIGKIEISREEVEEDEPVKKEESSKKEEPSKNNAGSKKLIGTVVSHMGKTLNEIKAMYGDHIETNGSGMFYYTDRLNGIQFYTIHAGNGETVINEIMVKSSGYAVAECLNGNETADELLDQFGGSTMPGENREIMVAIKENGKEHWLIYRYGDDMKAPKSIWIVQ